MAGYTSIYNTYVHFRKERQNATQMMASTHATLKCDEKNRRGIKR
jgi:hypothetical protein